MAAQTYNLTGTKRIDQGADYSMRIRPSSNVLEFAGATIRGQIRKKASDSVIVAEFDVSEEEDQDGVYFVLSIPADETAEIPVRGGSTHVKESSYFVYDIEAELEGGMIIRLIEGIVEVSPEVTKDAEAE